jgi:hypothetical protein
MNKCLNDLTVNTAYGMYSIKIFQNCMMMVYKIIKNVRLA